MATGNSTAAASKKTARTSRDSLEKILDGLDITAEALGEHSHRLLRILPESENSDICLFVNLLAERQVRLIDEGHAILRTMGEAGKAVRHG